MGGEGEAEEACAAAELCCAGRVLCCVVVRMWRGLRAACTSKISHLDERRRWVSTGEDVAEEVNGAVPRLVACFEGRGLAGVLAAGKRHGEGEREWFRIDPVRQQERGLDRRRRCVRARHHPVGCRRRRVDRRQGDGVAAGRHARRRGGVEAGRATGRVRGEEGCKAGGVGCAQPRRRVHDQPAHPTAQPAHRLPYDKRPGGIPARSCLLTGWTLVLSGGLDSTATHVKVSRAAPAWQPRSQFPNLAPSISHPLSSPQ